MILSRVFHSAAVEQPKVGFCRVIWKGGEKEIDLFTWDIIESIEKKEIKSESNQSTSYPRMNDCSERNNLSDAQESR